MKYIAIILALTLAACQTTVDSAGISHKEFTPAAKQVFANAGKVIGSTAVDILINSVTSKLTGQTTQSATFVAANALWQNINKIDSSEDVKTTVVNNGIKAIPAIANAAAAAYNRSTNNSSISTVNAIAAVISAAAGAPPPPSTVK